MNESRFIKEKLLVEGFAVIDNIFSDKEIENLIHVISKVDTSRQTFRKTTELFAIRQFF